jgi:hypothetical protein
MGTGIIVNQLIIFGVFDACWSIGIVLKLIADEGKIYWPE